MKDSAFTGTFRPNRVRRHPSICFYTPFMISPLVTDDSGASLLPPLKHTESQHFKPPKNTTRKALLNSRSTTSNFKMHVTNLYCTQRFVQLYNHYFGRGRVNRYRGGVCLVECGCVYKTLVIKIPETTLACLPVQTPKQDSNFIPIAIIRAI